MTKIVTQDVFAEPSLKTLELRRYLPLLKPLYSLTEGRLLLINNHMTAVTAPPIRRAIPATINKRISNIPLTGLVRLE
jgi:hypothetical protein